MDRDCRRAPTLSSLGLGNVWPVPFGDPWTAAQQRLVDVVMAAWASSGDWPTYDHVASELEDEAIETADILRSFPVLGSHGMFTRSYGDVRFDHIHPQPPDDSKISLSVSGLHRHPLGGHVAQAFIAVLRLAAERRRQERPDPAKVVETTLTSDDIVSALPEWPWDALRHVGALIAAEWPVGVRSTGSTPETETWTVTVGREVTRYLNLTYERYMDLVRRDVELASAGTTPTVTTEPPAQIVLQPVTRRDSLQASMNKVSLMKPEQAVRELRQLKDAADTEAVRIYGPAHDEWKAKVRVILQRALGRDASVLKDFNNVSYSVGVWTGSPGEDERDRQYFASQVGTAVAYIQAAIYELELDADTPVNPSFDLAGARQTVFMVHGHDGGVKHEVARFVERITGNAPIILDEQANRGHTLVEKFETHANTAVFAIVLLTPDDVGRVANSATENDAPRARQNVVFELGYFFGKLGRNRVAVINSGVDRPSDVDGLVYISYPASEWRLQLAKELQAAGLQIDASKLLT